MDGKIDKRRFNGGKREGAGRKSKAEEMKVNKYCSDAIIEVYGSLEKYYVFIAKEAKTSFPHLKMLQEYFVGKTKDRIEIDDITENKPDTILRFRDYTEEEN